MKETFFTVTSIHTLSGASLAILLIMHISKNIPYLCRVPKYVLALATGEILIFLTSHMPGSLGEWIVEAINGLLVSTTAIGGWHLSKSNDIGKG